MCLFCYSLSLVVSTRNCHWVSYIEFCQQILNSLESLELSKQSSSANIDNVIYNRFWYLGCECFHTKYLKVWAWLWAKDRRIWKSIWEKGEIAMNKFLVEICTLKTLPMRAKGNEVHVTESWRKGVLVM